MGRIEDGFIPSVIIHEDGCMTTRCGYGEAVRRLHLYEDAGVLPEDAGKKQSRICWERYTMELAGGEIIARRGWEFVLGRLHAYEIRRLSPEQWRIKYGTAGYCLEPQA